MDDTQSRPPAAWWAELDALRAEVGQLRRDVIHDSTAGDQLASHLEQRVAAIEEVLAARGWRRLVLRRRLGRHLRSSVVAPGVMPGGWRARRTEYVSQTWDQK